MVTFFYKTSSPPSIMTLYGVLALLYISHLANLTGIAILKPLAILDKLFRLLIALSLLITWAITTYIFTKSEWLGYDIVQNYCFRYASFTFGYLFPKILGFKTIYTKKINVEQPMLYISNHHHLADGWPISVLGIPAYWVAKHDLHVEVPIFGPFLAHVLKYANLIFYKKRCKESGNQVKERIVDVIKREKRSVVLYPEGTTQRCGSPIMEFYDGSFKIAYEHNIPVQPMSLRFCRDIGSGPHDVASVSDFLGIIDLTIVCDPGEVIVKRTVVVDGKEECESFKEYMARVQGSITPGLYYEY